MVRIVTWSRRAIRDLAALDGVEEKRVRAAVGAFAADGRGDIKRLKGKNPPRHRLRVGSWRVVIELRPDALVVHGVAHRREVYR